MKKVSFLIAMLIGFAMIAEAKDINVTRHHKRCKGWHKSMLKPKNNWKSYVRYR
jgi:Na+/melibiose symporter-like transporter